MGTPTQDEVVAVTTEAPRPATAFRLLLGEVEAWWPDRNTRLANDLLIDKFDAALAEAATAEREREERLEAALTNLLNQFAPGDIAPWDAINTARAALTGGPSGE
jgi:hypothetical protein